MTKSKKNITLAIIREGKTPPDKRVPFTPLQAAAIEKTFNGIHVVCEHSNDRAFHDDEYRAAGIEVLDDVTYADVFFGIKEVPIASLVPAKTYFFFSHTIKKQPHNQALLKAILDKKITLVDYETLTDVHNNRLVAFGRYAGIVGAYNALWTYGQRFGGYSLRRAYECRDLEELKSELKKVKLPAIKIVLTGSGRVGSGAAMILRTAGIREVPPTDFTSQTFSHPVFTTLRSKDYHVRKSDQKFDQQEFYQYPERYDTNFHRFAETADVLVAGAYWNPKGPRLFSKQEMTSPSFTIKIIADITCDIDGSIPSTKKASSVLKPLYDYNARRDTIEPPLSSHDHVTVMAIDNLPCELPRSASEDFGNDLLSKVLPALFTNDADDIIERATITRNGVLLPRYAYLRDYVGE